MVADRLGTFLDRDAARGRTAPPFVEREFRRFLECGIHAHGFLRVRCDACDKDRVVPLSCKGRGFCPSCGGRRMADTAAHLVDRILPVVPVRQWVLTLAAEAVLEASIRTDSDGVDVDRPGELFRGNLIHQDDRLEWSYDPTTDELVMIENGDAEIESHRMVVVLDWPSMVANQDKVSGPFLEKGS